MERDQIWFNLAAMGAIRDSVTKAAPWIKPVLDYFDWKRRLAALVAGVAIAVWSFVKDLPWPIVVTLAIVMVVVVAYALVFPAFLKLGGLFSLRFWHEHFAASVYIVPHAGL